MKKISGRTVALSAPRRLIGDMLYASQQLPLTPAERTMQLGELMEARRFARPRPSWIGMFVKALATVAARHPELRRVYLTRPWHRLYEYDQNIISVVVERDCGGEPGLFLARLYSPEKLSLAEIDEQLRRFKEQPLPKIRAFRNALYLARLPLFVRRAMWSLIMNWLPKARASFVGTLGLSLTAGMGGCALSLFTPWTGTIFYDMLADDGSLKVRSMMDHRVLDGHLACRVGKELEAELRGPILDEVRALMPAARQAA